MGVDEAIDRPAPHLGRAENLADASYRWGTRVEDAGLTHMLGRAPTPRARRT